MGLCCGVVQPPTHGKGDGKKAQTVVTVLGVWDSYRMTLQDRWISKVFLFIFEVVLPKSQDLLSLLPTLIFLVTST